MASRIRGNEDLLSGSELLFDAGDVNDLQRALQMATDKVFVKGETERNALTLEMFSLEQAVNAMKNVYTGVVSEIAPVQISTTA